MQVQPYLFFEGRCEEAARFYAGTVGAKVEMQMRMSESPEPHPPGMMPAGTENKIMMCWSGRESRVTQRRVVR